MKPLWIASYGVERVEMGDGGWKGKIVHYFHVLLLIPGRMQIATS